MDSKSRDEYGGGVSTAGVPAICGEVYMKLETEMFSSMQKIRNLQPVP